MSIEQLTTNEQWVAAYPVMQELRPHLSLEEFLQLLKEMTPQGYRLYARLEASEIVALIGVIQLVNLYHFKHLYVYDLITKSSERSKGYGAQLLSFIHKLAKEEGCQSVALSSGLQRLDAHRFYEEKMGYTKTSFSFKFTL